MSSSLKDSTLKEQLKNAENIPPQPHSNGDKKKQTTVCVFCGASSGTSPIHLEAARSLARAFHENSIHLVYGGGTSGIMGELAKTLVSLSGPEAVHGIIPKALLRFERNYVEDGEIDPQEVIDQKTFGRTTVVSSMHERKQMMAKEVMQGDLGSGFVALSGGYGTLEELAEVVTWSQLNIHDKGVVVFDVDGFWSPLLKWVHNAVSEGFISQNNSSIIVEATTAEQVVERLKTYQNAEGRFKLDWEHK